MVLYVNGASQSSKTPPADLNSNTASLSLGAQAGATQLYTGRMDEVRIWNRALCQAEIQANMNKELAPGQNGLVAYYKMNQGTAGGANTGITTLTDVSGSGSNGTLAGFDLTNGNTISNWVAGSNQITGTATTPFVETTTGITQTMSGTNPATFTTTCSDFAKLIPSGGAATQVTGSVTAIQRMDASVQSANGVAYVQRHYDLLATTNPTTATANVTLYFTQAEFDAYNAANGTAADLPVSSSDNTGKGNLRVTQFHGTPTGGYAPANYPATWGGNGPAHVTITPGAANVVWNSTAARWEVTFPITGFSGFFVSGVSSTPLPVKLLSFTATNVGTRNRIDWSTAGEDAGTHFEITRSSNGIAFDQIGEATGKGPDAAYTFYDNQPINGVSYYRLKITEANGEIAFSNVAVVSRNAKGGTITVSPVPATSSIRITSSDASLDGITAIIYNMEGVMVYRATLTADQTLDISNWASGIYSLHLANGAVVRIVKQ